MRDPLKLAADMLDAASKISPYFLCATSGGKDSAASLQLVAEARKRNPAIKIQGYYLYVVKGLDCIERPIGTLCKNLDVRVHKMPHFSLSRILYQAAFRPTTEVMDEVQVQSLVECERAARITAACVWSGIEPDKMWRTNRCECAGAQELLRALDAKKPRPVQPLPGSAALFGIESPFCGLCNPKTGLIKEVTFDIDKLVVDPAKIWVVRGERQSDSLQRRAWLSEMATGVGKSAPHKLCPSGKIGFDLKFYRCFPVAEWSVKEIWVLMRQRRLPLPPRLGDGTLILSGMNLWREQCMRWIKKNAPGDWAKIVKQFPLVEAQVFRADAT